MRHKHKTKNRERKKAFAAACFIAHKYPISKRFSRKYRLSVLKKIMETK